MIRAFFKYLFICLLVAAIFYYLQWHNLEPETKFRIERVLGFLPILLVSLMASYTVIGLGMVAFAALRGLSESMSKRAQSDRTVVPQPQLITPKERSQS